MAKAQDTLALLRQLPVEILPTDELAVFSAAHIKANYILLYADAIVVAAAQRKGAIVLTSDPEFQSVKELIAIEWLD